MQVDSFTLVAQIVNFLILVYLLKRFLYRPILDAMDRREADIVARLRSAEQREQEASAERSRLQDEHEALTARRQALLDQARKDAEQERLVQLAAVRQELERARQDWRLELQREREQFLLALRRELAGGVCTLARRALADLADAELQDQVMAVFLRRLRHLPEEQRRVLRRGAEEDTAQVISAFVLGPAQRKQLQAALTELLERPVEPHFETEAGLICGIAVQTGQGEVVWSVAEYLTELEEQLRIRLDGLAAEADDAIADSAG